MCFKLGSSRSSLDSNRGRRTRFAENQVDAAILAAATGFLDEITKTPKSLAHQLLELAPTHRLKAFEAGLGFEQSFSLQAFEEGHRCSSPTSEEKEPGEGREQAAEIPRANVSDDADHKPKRPRHRRDGIQNAFLATCHDSP
jgi:hypothetical protein